ncbi:hypothetical protein SELMODRAFT_165673 [Selaginella moellendorffii]|uniref:Golgi apparatus membrane protein TVP15 n=1 Tax=Selaginella moellendorffii TaxID=88036 RepID=D8QVW4_SELML|nr:uncharacterized protein LOC9648050 [Selaginella moellendorffii]XP_024518146.1 uncharacterized protein LOC9643276 [Selaginella moellendorffii]EFJ18687.1 hypothetical protein SELMODRAFT_178192 [Selaginella moellendorffii]EFJ36529.1 hypothetical protein SELMODRAFT_165673 [Selaginella moellendorffii]|eukprot:XP_002980427.1 uncharacterized protein LOC9648050 [Selaginella moellendorffii]
MGSILNEGLTDGAREDHHDEEAAGQSSHHEQSSSQGSDPLVITFRIFNVITAIAALLCTAVNIISVVRSFKHGRDIFEGILRCYAVIIALFVAVAETELEHILKFWRVLEYWVGRGMLQIFVGVMTKALSNEHRDKAYQVVLAEVASGLLLACGAIYVIAGLLCVGKLKRSRVDKSNWREKAVKDLEDMDRKRDELQALLSK